jgi:hypothetical protein
MKNIFSCFKKNSHLTVSTYEQSNEICCDINGFIINVSNDVLSTLLYERNMLVGQFIGIIMSPFMSYIHSTILLPKYKTASKFERNIMHIFLNGKTIKRPLIIYTIMKKPLYVTLSVTVHKNSEQNTFFKLEFKVVDDFCDSSVFLTSQLSSKLFARFRQTKNPLIMANVEFTNNAKYITDHSEMKDIDICLNFQQDVIRIIKQHFYPYIYIYETSNRGCVIVSNLCCTYNMPRFCASLIICLLYNIQSVTDKYATLRVGLTYEKGYIGSTANDQIRIFGRVYDNAFANMINCGANEVCCSGDFMNKLINEKIYTKLTTYRRPCYDQSGVVINNVNFIDVTKIDNLVLHESSHELSDVNDKDYIQLRVDDIVMMGGG